MNATTDDDDKSTAPTPQELFLEQQQRDREREYTRYLQQVPDFGIRRPSLKKAAELVVVDMWYSDQVRSDAEPEEDVPDEYDPLLKSMLAGESADFEQKLLAAVDSGRLKAWPKLRHIKDETLVAERTHVEYGDLCGWLRERGYEAGDVMVEWEKKEAEIAALVCKEIAFLRTATKIRGSWGMRHIADTQALARLEKLDEARAADLVAAYKAAIAETDRLRERLRRLERMVYRPSPAPAPVDRPITTRQRRTLLTIIAALCEGAKIEYAGRGAAQRIKELTEEIGARVGDDTILTVLSEIPDALDSRGADATNDRKT